MSFIDNILKIGNEKEIIGLTTQLKSIYIYNQFKKEKKPILIVTTNMNEAEKLYTSLTNHTDKVWLFPMDNFLTSEALATSPEFKNTRLETINNIIKEEKSIVITNLMGYLRFLPSKEKFKNSYITIEKNKEYSIKEIIKILYKIGYQRQSTVNMTGEMAERGFVIDIFPINKENPIRIEFWDTQVESIKTFDVNSQRTIKNIDKITIYPNTEFLVDKEIQNKTYKEIAKYTKTTNILNYLNNPIVFFNNYQKILLANKQLEDEIINYSINNKENPNTKYMNKFEEIRPKNYKIFETFDNHFFKEIKNYKTKEIVPFKETQINAKLNNYLKQEKKVIICLENRYQINQLIDKLDNKKLIYTNENKIFDKKINLIVKKISQGFEIEEYVVLTPREIYGKQIDSSYKSKFKYGTRIKDITKLEIGDFVVHGTHGIGKYLGIKTIQKQGLNKDYLMIEYQGKDKLYIPVEKIELINKYSSKEGIVPKLNKLGGIEWAKTKARAKKRAEDIAEELLKLYAIRESKEGFAFPKDTEEQIIFENEFEYEETPDQIKVTNEIKKDMEKPEPMDRLLCGDVGYGKTEVAFRAIFKCIMGGKQAAILCPTTILSSQHFTNAINRFKTYPIKIELLNRFISLKDQKRIINELKKGKIDLLIGTHRILSQDIEFKNLGLLVIDEEQRFGVKQKEKIKKYKNNIDVLTLSATPIPRTLQLSMSGIRSISIIETPPALRYPIQTYVLPENSQIIKEAIEKEISRKGQTFILFNSIENIETKQLEIQKLVPDANIRVAHGQMDKYKLEQVMNDFNNQKFDTLICTTIIETGIDIPTVNTLIIIDADKFGLSQLYQIRGRIGRSNKIAYCYLMYNNRKIMSEVATKRLKVIKEFTQLGSGFAIAMKDLSIRGAGDILGKQQSGYIDAVGIDMFLEMLKDAVNKLKGKEEKPQKEDNKALIEVETYISDNYVSDEDLKIEIHKKINEIKNYKKLQEVKKELEDRFGKISEEIIIYMYEQLFEQLAKTIDIQNIRQTKNFIEITLSEKLTKNIEVDKLFYEISKKTRMFRFSMKYNKINIILDTVKLEKHFIYYLIDLVKIIKDNIKK